MSTVQAIRAGLGGTVNDVLLTAITSGFRDLLDSRGELAGELVVRSLVPVSVRSQDEQGVITNRISAVLANLPVAEPDPQQRLALLREQMIGCVAVAPLLLLWMRSVARLTRKLADRWCGVPIAEPYLPKPWADDGKRGPRRGAGGSAGCSATLRPGGICCG